MRLTWDSTWLAIAHVIAKRSLCARDQVGAVIVDKTQRHVWVGYNGPPAGFKRSDDESDCSNWCQRAQAPNQYTEVFKADDVGFVKMDKTLPPALDYSDCPAIHAEANALMMSDRHLRIGGTIYITRPPCFSCAKLIANSGLNEACMVATKLNSSNKHARSINFLGECGIKTTLMISEINIDLLNSQLSPKVG